MEHFELQMHPLKVPNYGASVLSMPNHVYAIVFCVLSVLNITEIHLNLILSFKNFATQEFSSEHFTSQKSKAPTYACHIRI